MQPLGPATAADLLSPAQKTVHRFEVYDGSSWVDLTALGGKSYLKSMSCQVAGAGPDTEPLAGTWSVVLDNEDGVFHPYHPTSGYAALLRLGREARLSWGITYDTAAEKLGNGDLESWSSVTDAGTWVEQIGGSSTINREESSVHGGAYAAQMDVDSSAALCNIYQIVTLTASAEYRARFWHKTTNGKPMALWITTYPLDYLWDGTAWVAYTGQNIQVPASADWAEYIENFTAHASYTQYLIGVGAATGVSTSCSIYADDISVRQAGLWTSAKYWQRVIGYMDTPRFDSNDRTVTISGTDYTKALSDTALASPYTNWGASATFDSQASPTGTGTEIYDEGDACEIGSGEADNVANWTGNATSEGPSPYSSYYLQLVRLSPGPDYEYAHNSDCGNVTAGNQYRIAFYARVTGEGYGRLLVYQTVGSTAVLVGEAFISGDDWRPYQTTVSVTATGAVQLRLVSGGKYADADDVVCIDQVSIKLYDPDTWMIYELPAGCNGVYYVTLNGEPVWQGDEDGQGGWHYSEEANALYFSEELVIDAGEDNLVVYYYTSTAPEDVVADLLVAGHLYADRTAAKSAMTYTATGITIPRVWFEPGSSALEAARLLCERCNYRFWFGWDGTPNFRPAPTKATPSDFAFTEAGHIDAAAVYQDLNEVRNHITIEGAERSVLNVSTREIERSTWKGAASSAASIAAYQQKSHAISNHLFQDQGSVDDMCAELLAYYKDPKFYLEFGTRFMPVPLEVGDTVTLELPFSTTDSVTKYGIIRAINLSDNETRYTAEIYVPFDTGLAGLESAIGLTAAYVELVIPGQLFVGDAVSALAAESPSLVQIKTYTNYQNGTSLAVPSGATQAVIECWGGGGEGGYDESGFRGGGGGGGAYSKATVSVEYGQTLTIYLPYSYQGAATRVLRSGATLCAASAGYSGDTTSGGTGGQASAGTGDLKYSGGNGFWYTTGYTGGGGGGSAGPSGNGNNAASSTGAVAVTGGGPGGNGGARYYDGEMPAVGPGGGGGGAGQSPTAETVGGLGWIGKIVIRFS